MNFSINNKLRKILSLVIALVMLTTLFTGCMKKKPVDNTEPPLFLDEDPSSVPETDPVPAVTEAINENMATVLSQINVRSSPSDQAVVVGTVFAGDKVEVVQTQTSLGVTWGYIVQPIAGWVCMEFVEMDYKSTDATEPVDSTDGEPSDRPVDDEDPVDKLDKDGTGNNNTTVLAKGYVTAANTLNVRKSPSTSADIVGSLKNGARVEILEKNGNWGRIDQGWISLDLVALDSNGSNSNTNSNSSSTSNSGNGSTTVVARGIVNTKSLNIRKEPDAKSDLMGTYPSGTRVEILEKSNGWGRTNKGWIALNYVYIDGSGTGNNKTGVVTASQLKIRSGPGTDYATVGSYNQDDEVTILFHVTVGNTIWGNVKQGWISMDYVDMDDANWDEEDDTTTDVNDDDVLFYGVVTAKGLNIRKTADSDGDTVGTYSYGARVAILEEDGSWGRTNKGWISLKYVYEDGTGEGDTYGTISGSGVNIRSGPGTTYGVVGSLDRDDEVTVLFEIEIGDTTWGNIDEGWISMRYVDVG